MPTSFGTNFVGLDARRQRVGGDVGELSAREHVTPKRGTPGAKFGEDINVRTGWCFEAAQ